MPGTAKVLRTVVKRQHQLIGIAQAEHPALDIAGRHDQRGEVVLRLGHDAFAGQVENADHMPLGIAQRHRGAGKRAESVQVMLAAVDQGRAALDHRRADGVGAAARLAPATAWMQVTQAGLIELGRLATDGQDVGLRIAENDHPAVALAGNQVFHFRCSGVDQQTVTVEQLLQALTYAQLDLIGAQAAQAMAQAAPPRGINFFAQHALRQGAFTDKFQAGHARCLQWIGSNCYWYMSRHL
ncbi:hypothetical protein D3C78_605220 [compost metagenome]